MTEQYKSLKMKAQTIGFRLFVSDCFNLRLNMYTLTNRDETIKYSSSSLEECSGFLDAIEKIMTHESPYTPEPKDKDFVYCGDCEFHKIEDRPMFSDHICVGSEEFEYSAIDKRKKVLDCFVQNKLNRCNLYKEKVPFFRKYFSKLNN
jgi:hypothetical protein